MATSGDTYYREDAQGNVTTLTLTDRIETASGEGEVWRTRNGEIAKLYFSHLKDIRERGEKLRVMIAAPPTDPGVAEGRLSIAWPIGLLRKSKGGAIEGFAMPEVRSGKRTTVLFQQRLRKEVAPGIDWFYFHTAALNIARICRAVHQRGYAIGDLKADNFMIDASMSVAIIDTDSFQVRDPKSGKSYPCPVMTPEYSPYEMTLPNAPKDALPEHDHFAMAVLIYYLLMGGHPFSGGVWKGSGAQPSDTTAPERIKLGDWLHSGSSRFAPVLSDAPFNLLHPELQRLFRRCFNEGHRNPKARPSAKDWEEALDTAIASLAWCEKVETHVYSGHLKSCGWCAFKKSSNHDRWPVYKAGAAKSFEFLQSRVKHAFREREFERVLAAFDVNPRLRSDRGLAQIRKDAENWRPVMIAREKVAAELSKPQPDDAAVERIIAGEPRVLDSINGSPLLRDAYARLIGAKKAIAELEVVIAASPETGGMAKIAGERAIIDVFETNKAVLQARNDLAAKYGPRTTAARTRLVRYEQMTKLLQADDERRIAETFQEHQRDLAKIEDFVALRPHVDAVTKRVAAIDAFIAKAGAAKPDEADLVRLWDAVPDVATSALARTGLSQFKGRSPADRAALAKARVEAERDLVQLVDSLDLKAGTSIIETNERQIVDACSRREPVTGGLDMLAGGRVSQRRTMAQERVRVFDLARRLAARPPSDDLATAREWRGVKLPERYRLDQAIVDRLRSAEVTTKGLEAILVATNANQPDEAAILSAASANANVLDTPAALETQTTGLSIRGRVELAQQRLQAQADVTNAIALADAVRVKMKDGESGIVAAWLRHERVLGAWARPGDALLPRVRLARARIDRGEELASAAARGDEAALVAAWGTDGALDDYAPAATHRSAVDAARNLAQQMQSLKERLLSSPHDDAAVIALGRRVRHLLTTPYATTPLADLGGASLAQCVAMAERRSSFVEALEGARGGGNMWFSAVAEKWDDAFGTDHPRIKPHVELIKKARLLSGQKATLRAAVQAGDQAQIVASWNDAAFGDLPEFHGELPRIRQALSRHVDAARPFSSAAEGVKMLSPDRYLVTWKWSDASITHANVYLNDKRPSTTGSALQTRQIDKDSFLTKGGLEVAFSGGLLVAEVRPVVKFRREDLVGPNGLLVRDGHKRELTYRVERSMLGLGGRTLRIKADRKMTLPELQLADDDGAELLSFGAMPTTDDGLLALDLGRRLSWGGRPVRLRLRHGRDSDWVEIADPAEHDRQL